MVHINLGPEVAEEVGAVVPMVDQICWKSTLGQVEAEVVAKRS